MREAYGRTTYGQSCLLARRLVERGVKFVTAYIAPSIGGRSKTSGGWDTHGFDDTRMFEILPEWHFPNQLIPHLNFEPNIQFHNGYILIEKTQQRIFLSSLLPHFYYSKPLLILLSTNY